MQARYSNELLSHYTSQWRDREVYWLCRQRSRTVRDILCCIIDSYDKAKVALPTFPQRRVPKSQVYETIRRPSSKKNVQDQSNLSLLLPCFFRYPIRRVSL
jgi:hypothetical protein